MIRALCFYTITLALSCAHLSAADSADSAQVTELSLASDVWPPFTDTFQKNRFAIDIVHTALGRAGIQADTEILDEWTIPSDLKAGKFDGSAAIWKTPEREDYLLFSQPYLENRIVLVGEKGSDVSAGDLSALKGKTLLLVKGYAYGEILESADGVKITYGPNDIENIKSLLGGEADYILVDELLVHHLAKEMKTTVDQHIAVGAKPLTIQPLHFAIRKEVKGAEAIIDSFNKQIRIMQADGTYNRILRLSWIRVDVDGDGKMELVQGGEPIGPDAPVGAYDVAYTSKSLAEIEGRKRYWINGKLYEDWDNVQEDYEIQEDFEESDLQGVRLFNRSF
ncbi:MAG: substrate-binding periplasmic protein [Coraliomargarita sp.]